MRVIHLACVAPPEIGGIGASAWREVTGLRQHGVDACLLAPEMRDRACSTHARNSLVRVPYFFRVGNASWLRGSRVYLENADLIHVHYPFYGTAEWIRYLAPYLPPIVMTYHMDAMADGWKGTAFKLHRRLFQSWIFDMAEHVFVSSYDYVMHASCRTWFVEHTERVSEASFGVDADLFFPGPSVKPRFGLTPEAKTIAFVGGMDCAHAFKGLPILLQALAQLSFDVHLLAVGDGDERAKFETMAKELGVWKRCHFLGIISEADLVDVYRSAEVFVLPSTSRAEAFGLAAVEAQACGCPIVASDLPGLRSVIIPNRTGYLFPCGDVDALCARLSSFFSDPFRHEGMRQLSHEQAVQRFSWERHVDRLMKVYQKICASRF